MERMAAETTLKADVKEKGRASRHQDDSAWARRDRFQSGDKASTSADKQGEISGDLKQQGASLYPLNKQHPGKSPSPLSAATNNRPSPPKSNMGVDCADVVLNCLFCRFHDMIPILPDCCQRLTHHCWPSYKHVDRSAESSHSDDDDDACVELDCGFCGSCHDASDCLELAMEVSEICYR